ncbi:MAG: hypothetical protein LBF55_06885 [Prevotellaceae bacterium]|jgi:hypothetical protein|nr:hypothetical protein [Prevotellaceae bacterium]
MDGMLVAIYKHVIRVFGGKNQQKKADRSEHPTLRDEQKRQFEMHPIFIRLCVIEDFMLTLLAETKTAFFA